MPVKICYINHFGYKMFDKKYPHPYAGAETAIHEEAVEIAKDKNYDVHMLVEADEEKKFRKHNITVWTMQWIPVNRFVQYKTRPAQILKYHLKLWKKLREINANIYIHRAALGEIRLTTALFCKKHSKKYLYVVPGTPARMLWKPVSFLRWVIFDRASMQLADKIVAISNDQLKRTPPRTHAKTTIIHIGKSSKPLKKNKREFFLFVGRNNALKQPDLFVKLAELMPEEKFVLICPYEKPVPSNMKVLPFVPNEKMHEYYSKAIALISLSKEEGFGNVYVEAWRAGTPVISLHTDVDETICRYGLGFHSHTFEQLLQDIKSVRKNWRKLSHKCRAYFEKNHDIKKQIQKYKKILE
ncbi:MAG: glycosyltransferase family 4 protein [Candidatus Woesearchaeota archaeon]